MRELNKKGFTLIEVIAAVAIMGVLTGTVITGVSSSLRKSHDNHCSQQVDMMVVAGRDYFNDNKTKLPLEIGGEECVSLSTLMGSKYIESMKDYSGSLCNPVNSKVCAMKITGNNYYYAGYLDCGKCSTKNTGDGVQEAPKIKFVPNQADSMDKDIVVEMKFDAGDSQILSYMYTIYETDKNDKTASNGKPVKQIDFREYDNKKVEIVLNKSGYYYIEGYAYNALGKRGYQKSGIYHLAYTFDCSNSIKISAKRANVDLMQKTWVNGAIDVNVEAGGAVSYYDVLVAINAEGVNPNHVVWNTVLSNAVGSNTISYTDRQTGKYSIKVKGYDSAGGSCETDSVIYYQDNNPPFCKTKVVYDDERTKSYDGNWTNRALFLQPQCTDMPNESGCDNNKNFGRVLSGNYNAPVSAGVVYDKAGNSNNCSNVNVKIGTIEPSCEVTLSGILGKNEYYTSAVKVNLKATSKSGQPIVSYDLGPRSDELALKTISNPTDTLSEFTTYSNQTNTNIIYYAKVVDAAGNTATCQSKPFKLDSVKPQCNFSVSGEANANDWKKGTSKPTVNLTCDDRAHPEGTSKTQGSGCVKTSYNNLLSSLNLTNKSVSTKQVSQRIYDNAGNYADCKRNVNIYKDNKAPTCGTWVGNNTWTNSNVTIKIGCNEDTANGSGCKKTTYSKTYKSKNEEITSERIKIEICDKVGNCRTCDSSSTSSSNKGTCDSKNCKDGKVLVKHDTKAPECSWSGGSKTWINKAMYDSNPKVNIRTIKLKCKNENGSGCLKDAEDNKSEKIWKYGKDKEVKTTNLSYTIKDKAGNSTNCSKNVNVYVDTIPPRISSCGFYNMESQCIANYPGWRDYFGVGITAYDSFLQIMSDDYTWDCGRRGINNQCHDGKLLIPERIVKNAFGAALCSTESKGHYDYHIEDEAGNVTELHGRFEPTVNVSCKNYLDK